MPSLVPHLDDLMALVVAHAVLALTAWSQSAGCAEVGALQGQGQGRGEKGELHGTVARRKAGVPQQSKQAWDL